MIGLYLSLIHILHNKIHSVISPLFRIKNTDTETGWNVRILRSIWIISAEIRYLLLEQKDVYKRQILDSTNLVLFIGMVTRFFSVSLSSSSNSRLEAKMCIRDRVVALLAMGEPLPDKNRDHDLSGDWAGHRECHILPDWLLVYRIEDDVLVLTLARTGTHSDLFGK